MAYESSVRVRDLFFVRIVLEVFGCHEVAGVEDVRTRRRDFIEIGFRIEARVAQERLIDRAKLLDSELCIRNTSLALAASRPRLADGKRIDDSLPNIVRYLCIVEERRPLWIEEVCFQWQDSKCINTLPVPSSLFPIRYPLFPIPYSLFPLSYAPPYLCEQLLDGAVEVVPAFIGVCHERHGLEIAKMVEAVCTPEHVVHVLSCLEIPEILARLQEKHKQEAVHHNDALFGKSRGRYFGG